MMDVSIILVNYNTCSLCINCIDSIKKYTTDCEYEIIVVDNNSSDGSYERLNERYGEQIKLLQAGDNLGFGRANNLASKVAIGECLFFLNTDTLLTNNGVKILYDFLKSHPDCGICGGNLINAQGNPMHSFKRERMDLSSLKVNGIVRTTLNKLTKKVASTDYNFSGQPQRIEGYITGADLMIRRNLFNQVGGFDSDFFMYFEENEMTIRVQKIGFCVYSVPDCRIIHLEGASSGKGFSAKRLRRFNESAVIFFEKVYGGDSREKCLKVLISNCNKSIIKRLATGNFTAVKQIKAEKKGLKKQLSQLKK